MNTARGGSDATDGAQPDERVQAAEPVAPVGWETAKLNSPTDSLQYLESVLHHRRIAFSRAAAIAFVESCWHLIEDEPDVWYWSERFIEAGAVRVRA